jgi:hypothetical protein
MTLARPPAHLNDSPPSATAPPVVRTRTVNYRAPAERLDQYLSYSAAAPPAPRSWRPTRPDADGSDGSPTAEASSSDPTDLRRLYKWGGRLSGTLIDLRWRFAGDLDQYLIYLIVMLPGLARQSAPRAGAPAALGLNAGSIADITGIPRETVRRKLRAMSGRGQVQRGDDGLFYPGPAANLDGFVAELLQSA